MSKPDYSKFFFPLVISILLGVHPGLVFAEGSLPGGGGIDWGEFPPNWDYIAPIPDPGKGRGDWTGGIDTINGKPCLCLTQPVNPAKTDPCKDRFYVDCYDLGPKEEPPVVQPPVQPPNKGPPKPGVTPPGAGRPTKRPMLPRGCRAVAGAGAAAGVGVVVDWRIRKWMKEHPDDPFTKRVNENDALLDEINTMACTGKTPEGEKLPWWQWILISIENGQRYSY